MPRHWFPAPQEGEGGKGVCYNSWLPDTMQGRRKKRGQIKMGSDVEKTLHKR